MTNNEINNFSMILYLHKIDKIIDDILSRNKKNNISFDILECLKNNTNNEKKLFILNNKQHQMNIGEIWQNVIGNYDGFIN